MSDIRICTQISIDSPDADQVSIRENPENCHYPNGFDARTYGQHLAGPVDRFWNKDRKEILVKILNGSEKVKSKIQQHAQEWNNYSVVKFVFIDSNDLRESHVRVDVNSSNRTWSCIGTECLTFPQHEPTMGFGWLTDATGDIEFGRVILHEFGHVLGFIHEHQSPEAEISWKKKKVYKYYRDTYGWTTDTVDRNIFDYYHYPHSRATQFDGKSIMTYNIPASFTTNGFFTAPNFRLSRDDKEFVAYLYPPDNAAT